MGIFKKSKFMTVCCPTTLIVAIFSSIAYFCYWADTQSCIPVIQPITPITIIEQPISIERSVVIIRNGLTQGSGVIIDSSGLIVTAAHMLELVDIFELTTTVILHDGTEYEAHKDIYVDWDLDVAIIRIDPNHPLTSVELVPSDNYPVGTPIVAIGTPYGYVQWHSYGHIASPRRGAELFLDLDTNPGNSGGPILVGNKCIGIIVSGIRSTDMSFGVASEVCLSALDLYRTLYE